MLQLQYAVLNKYHALIVLPSYYMHSGSPLRIYNEQLFQVSPHLDVPYPMPFCTELQPSSVLEVQPGTRGFREERIGWAPYHEIRQIRFSVTIKANHERREIGMIFEIANGQARFVDFMDVV